MIGKHDHRIPWVPRIRTARNAVHSYPDIVSEKEGQLCRDIEIGCPCDSRVVETHCVRDVRVNYPLALERASTAREKAGVFPIVIVHKDLAGVVTELGIGLSVPWLQPIGRTERRWSLSNKDHAKRGEK